jgi:ribose-phosphate pyrophosphokinase
VDLHNAAIEGFFSIPVEHLTAIPLLVDALHDVSAGNATIVAPDLGAVKLAQRYADLLGLRVAYVHKVRLSGQEVSVRGVIGDVVDQRVVVVDDMISTGATMISAIESLIEKGCRQDITVVASHGLLVGEATQRFASLPVSRILITDSVNQAPEKTLPIEIASIDLMLADAIRCLHENRSIGHWLMHQ